MGIRLNTAGETDVLVKQKGSFLDAFIHKIKIERTPPPLVTTEIVANIIVGNYDVDGNWATTGSVRLTVSGKKAEAFLRRNQVGLNLEAELMNNAIQRGLLPESVIVDDF